MDVLADILFQIFGELLFEAFATVLSKILEIFIRNVNVDKKFRKNVKFCLTYVFLILVTILLVISIFQSKTIFVILTLSFLLFQIILNAIEIIYHQSKKSFLMKTIQALKIISHYIFPTLLIVFGAIYLVDVGAKVTLMVFSSIALVAFLLFDLFRLVRYKRKNTKQVISNRTNILSNDIDV